MIGLSLSKCVREIGLDLSSVKEEDVDLIVARTKCRDRESFEGVLDEYEHTLWSGLRRRGEIIDPKVFRKIAERLWDGGKIYQPRLKEHRCPDLSDGQIWVDELGDINWTWSL